MWTFSGGPDQKENDEVDQEESGHTTEEGREREVTTPRTPDEDSGEGRSERKSQSVQIDGLLEGPSHNFMSKVSEGHLVVLVLGTLASGVSTERKLHEGSISVVRFASYGSI